MTRIIIATLAVLCFTANAHGASTLDRYCPIDTSGDSGSGYEGEFYDALMEAFFNDGGEWGPGENPGGWESPDPDEITIEPGDLLPGPIDNGNCMDYAWPGRCG